MALTRLDAWLRPHLDALVLVACRPVSVIAHVIGYVGWWAVVPDSPALVIALSLEAIVIGLVIVDEQQNPGDARDEGETG